MSPARKGQLWAVSLEVIHLDILPLFQGLSVTTFFPLVNQQSFI